ncbi:MAG: CinA family protein, partial [Planctomycetota bacterium]
MDRQRLSSTGQSKATTQADDLLQNATKMADSTEPGNIAAIELAAQLRDQLEQADCRIVLAESCTAGGISATLANLPGVSNVLCGGFVVYRNASKEGWLDV